MIANSRALMPAITHKLISYFDGRSTLGTGFAVDYRESSWLFTCWHNIGPASANGIDVTGELTARAIGFASDPATQFDLGMRRIVGATRDEHHLDIAAIELSPSEKPAPPYFDGRETIALSEFNPYKTFKIGGQQGGPSLIVDATAHFAWQGFPGQDHAAEPETHNAVGCAGLTSRYDWMLRYMPGGYPCASGCPVFEFSGNEARLAGIHVHHSSGTIRFSGVSSVGNTPSQADAAVEWGSAVPVEYLFDAIDGAADAGNSVVEIYRG